MGFVVLLKLLVKIFDVLPWPLITLIYPLYASIWAIENNSNSDNRKCLTYWVLFSLIWLFELSFSILIQWLPFWPYVKLIATCYLVVPHLDGAAYVYDHFLRPFFLMTMQALNSWLIQPKEDFLFSRSVNFLDAAERYIKENGHEELKKLIISESNCEEPNLAWTKIKADLMTENKEATTTKRSKCEEPNLAGTEIKAVVTTQNKEVAATEWVKIVEPNPAWTEKEACTAMEDKEMRTAVAEDRGIEVPNLPAPNDVGNEWTWGLCQVSDTKHRDMQQELKASEMAAKSKDSSASTAKKDDQPKVEPGKYVPKFRREKEACTAMEDKEMRAAVAEDRGIEVPDLAAPAPKDVKKEWTCALCQVSATCKENIEDHYRGKKHRAMQQELKASKMADKSKDSSASTAKKDEQPKVEPGKYVPKFRREKMSPK